MKIGVIGSGYVGLVTGICLASLGFKVCIIDSNKSKINKLRKAKVPFFEPRLEDILHTVLKKNKITFSTSMRTMISKSDVIFICVGTPQGRSGKPNLLYINQVKKELSKHIALQKVKRNITIFIKSTVPPKTTKSFQDYFLKKNINNVHFASNPEFLREGSAVHDFFNPDRIIIGSNSPHIKQVAFKIYKKIISKRKIVFTSSQSSEVIKYAANAFLATKISFINEVSRLTEVVNADILEVSNGIGLDKRIGKNFLNAGIGYGGSCFPKDTLALSAEYRSNHIFSPLINAVIKINETQKKELLSKIFSVFTKQELSTKSVLFLGSAFKPYTDDIRDSIGIFILQELSPIIKDIKVYEPIAYKTSMQALKNYKNIHFLKDLKSISYECFHFIVIATEYDTFSNLKISDLKRLKDCMVFDGRNIMSKSLLENNGIKYFGVGR